MGASLDVRTLVLIPVPYIGDWDVNFLMIFNVHTHQCTLIASHPYAF